MQPCCKGVTYAAAKLEMGCLWRRSKHLKKLFCKVAAMQDPVAEEAQTQPDYAAGGALETTETQVQHLEAHCLLD